MRLVKVWVAWVYEDVKHLKDGITSRKLVGIFSDRARAKESISWTTGGEGVVEERLGVRCDTHKGHEYYIVDKTFNNVRMDVDLFEEASRREDLAKDALERLSKEEIEAIKEFGLID